VPPTIDLIGAWLLTAGTSAIIRWRSWTRAMQSMTAKEQFEAAATDWDAAGRPGDSLVSGWRLLVLHCWSTSEGGRRDGMTSILSEFLRMSERVQGPDWLDQMLEGREACARCGESYRTENIKICTHCLATVCYRCAAVGGQAENGNPGCRCGGELVG
jgi:hypothetical protein